MTNESSSGETQVPELRSADAVAKYLLAAETNAKAVPSIAAGWPEYDYATAVRAQDLALAERVARGERITGVKLGVTSKAKQRQVNVDSPSTAWLTDAMLLPPETAIPRDALIHPRVEPEIAFLLGKPLKGPGVTAAEALAAVSHVFGAIEVIDSRFAGFSFTMADAVADNNSSARYVTGSVAVPPEGLDLALEAVLLEINGEIVETATGAAVHGHPAEALAFAANDFGARGITLEAGWIVLSGGMTEAVPVKPGMRIAAHFTNLGSITLSGG